MLTTTLVGCVLVVVSISAVRAEDDPLKELGERDAAQQKRYDEARAKAKTAGEPRKVFETLDPRNALVDEFLATERSQRGQPAAISVLYRVVHDGTSLGNQDIPATQGRLKAIRIIRDHYLEHPDLDLLIGYLNGGPFDDFPEIERLLRDAAKSPYQHVRAAAGYYLARFFAYKARMTELVGPGSPFLNSTDPDPESVEYRRKLRDQFNKLPIDPAVERKKALSLIEQIVAENSEIVETFAVPDGPGSLSIHRSTPEAIGAKPTTYAKLSESLRFELAHLQVGQVVPEITGKDADGLEFKLSDYRGRVVLLMFSANWCGPCKAMYPDIRKLGTELAVKPFAILAVMGDQNIGTVIHDTQSGDIRWRTWFDGDSGRIATTWNIQAWPTLYLIDHNGIIVARQTDRSYGGLKSAIDALLAAQQADPNAEAELKAHPLPELSILKRPE